MRLPFLRRSPSVPPAAAPERPRGGGRRRQADVDIPIGVTDTGPVVEARTRARRRLAGAIVLLAVGVVGFPVLFETQPRPLPIETTVTAVRSNAGAATPADARRSGGTVLPAPAAASTRQPAVRSEPQPLPATAAVAPDEVVVSESAPPRAAAAPSAAAPRADAVAAPAAVARAPAAGSTTAIAPLPLPQPASPAASPAHAAAAVRSPDDPRARALLEGARVPAAASVAGSDAAVDRYIVQIGAFTDAGTLHDARAKAEKLGFKTYTQVIESASGKRTRVRVGPYATRDEADAAAAKVKRAGLPANVIKL